MPVDIPGVLYLPIIYLPIFLILYFQTDRWRRWPHRHFRRNWFSQWFDRWIRILRSLWKLILFLRRRVVSRIVCTPVFQHFQQCGGHLCSLPRRDLGVVSIESYVSEPFTILHSLSYHYYNIQQTISHRPASSPRRPYAVVAFSYFVL